MTVPSWYREPHKLLVWVRKRSAVHHLRREHVRDQRRQSLYLLVFGVIRIICWTILAICVGLGLGHAAGFAWAKTLAESIPFVVLISIYANWATDLDAATAAFAALVAADGHAASESSRQLLDRDFAALEADITRLADMHPGDEAAVLAGDIRARLRGGERAR